MLTLGATRKRPFTRKMQPNVDSATDSDIDHIWGYTSQSSSRIVVEMVLPLSFLLQRGVAVLGGRRAGRGLP
jgi:hypothetical protein